MYYNDSSSQYSQYSQSIKQEHCSLSPYATPLGYDVGVARRASHFVESQQRGLDSRPAYSSYITTASSGASPSRTMMPQKRSSPGDNNDNGHGSPSKQIKSEDPKEFSKLVKKRLASSTRTGQACDRCKVRKIRCDGLAGGCSPCLQNNTDCRTTDRITGRATSRGYTEGLERENRDLQLRLHEMEQRLAQSGLTGKGYNGVGQSSYEYNISPVGPPTWNGQATYTPQSSASIAAGSQETNMFRTLPAFRSGYFGDNYLGVSPGNSNLSSVRGTALSILGMEIDIADFASADMDEPEPGTVHPQLFNKSYQGFLQSTLGINRVEKPNLPVRSEAMQYTDWYFRVLNPYMPVLHGPTFLSLITRMYDDNTFRPTVSQTVSVHMLFAIMYFQYAVRNREDTVQQADLNHKSNMHYHYSLTMFYQLTCSHSVQDVQALTLICMHQRNFPKPGASWMLTQTTMALAIELGMHRSVKRWASEAVPDPLEIEMRKRIFWAILAIHVTLSGKLGRPMPLRMEDFDVELPERYDDELLSENGLDTSRQGKCAYEIGLQAFSIVPLYMELYSTIYAVRRQPDEYMATIRNLEAKLRAWKEGLPRELVNGEAGSNEQEGRVFALYAHIWELEFRILLRHPSVSTTKDSTFNAESMEICVQASRHMLGVVSQLQKYRSLDTTWYNCAVYVMAITIMLFAQWDKRGTTTSSSNLDVLREEMNLWLDIMGEVGALLGSGTRLKEAVRNVIDGTLSLLNRSIPARSTYTGGPKTVEKPLSPTQRSDSTTTMANAPVYYDNNATSNGNSSSLIGYSPTDAHLAHSHTPYPVATQYPNYGQPPPSSIAYTPEDSSSAYAAYPPNTDGAGLPMLAAYATQNEQAQASNWQRSPHLADSGSLAWHQYTNTMTETLEPQDCYSASALIQLGRPDLSDAQGGPSNQASVALAAMAVNSQNGVRMDSSRDHMNGHIGGQNMSWPLNIFDISHGGSL